jgi:hypothetical protein
VTYVTRDIIAVLKIISVQDKTTRVLEVSCLGSQRSDVIMQFPLPISINCSVNGVQSRTRYLLIKQ